MKRFLFLLLFALPVFLQAQTFQHDPRSGIFPMSFRADTCTSTADSNWASFYVPQNMRIIGLQVNARTSDTAFFRIAPFGTEGTATDSVKTLSNTTSNMTVYTNNMTALLTKGTLYRVEYLPTHTGGASHTTMIDVMCRVWFQLVW